ncbi:MAG TPA: hypothetical protein PLN69_01695 [bacterium]|mgnify:CR=1 FL=1|nr:hypothetical protein [bacterium]
MNNNTSNNSSLFSLVWKTLGSMKLFCVLAFAIAFWFVVSMAIYPFFYDTFDLMDKNVLLDWFLHGECSIVKAWFSVLLLLMFILALNLSVCVIEDILIFNRLLKSGAALKPVLGRLSIFIVHLSYIVIISGHFITAVSGFRTTAPLVEGEVYEIPTAGYSIRCEQVSLDKGGGGRLFASSVFTVESGGNTKSIAVKQGKTLWLRGVMIDVELPVQNKKALNAGKKNSTPALPVIRLTRNYGLIFDVIGFPLFFIGMIMRIIFRPQSKIGAA